MELDEVCSLTDDRAGELLSLHAALEKLESESPDKAKLVKLRYFAGLTADQAAAALDISPSTADRQWAYARAWLRRAMITRASFALVPVTQVAFIVAAAANGAATSTIHEV